MKGLNQAKYKHKSNKPVMYIKKNTQNHVIHSKNDSLIRAGSILSVQRKDASSGKAVIRTFDRIKPASNSQ